MIDIRMPRLSDTMEEGTIAVWHKKSGDTVAVGDILVEIETDKATMEYEAYEAGVLHDILVPEGAPATIGMVIAHLDDGSGDTPTTGSGLGTPASAGERLFASPLVRRLAREHAIDLSQVVGSGPGGRIVRADIESAWASRDSTADGADAQSTNTPRDEADSATAGDARQSSVVPFDQTREVISRRLSESSSTAPHFFVTAAADIEALLGFRADLNAHLESAGRPKISINDILVRACAIALREHPGMNASYSPEGRGQTLVHDRVNIGIAVASPTGLVVPVIGEVDQKTASQVAAESRRLAGLAQDRRLSATDMTGGTFTISNLGMYGVEQFTAIINPPEGAILAVGAARAEPAVIDGVIEIRHRMRYTLSADHRIIDGALAAQFLATLTDLLEHPMNIIA